MLGRRGLHKKDENNQTWARGNTRLYHVRNEDTRQKANKTPVETFLQNKTKVVWPLFQPRTQPHKLTVCKIAKTTSFLDKELKEDMPQYRTY